MRQPEPRGLGRGEEAGPPELFQAGRVLGRLVVRRQVRVPNKC